MNKKSKYSYLSLFVTASFVLHHPLSFAQKAFIKPSSQKTLDITTMDSEDVSDRFDDVITHEMPTVNTLGSSLVAAYQNNPELESVRRSVLASNQNLTKARAGFLPSIDAQTYLQGSYSKPNPSMQPFDRLNETSLSRRTNSINGNIQLKQNLFAGGATLAAVESAEKAIRSQWCQLMDKEQSTFTNVIKAYIDLVTKIATVDVRKASKAAMQKNYDTSFAKHNIGEETITQVANAEAQLLKADAELRSAEADVLAARAQFIALTSVIPAQLEAPKEPTGLPSDIKKAILIAFDNHPLILQARYDYEAARAGITQANAALYSPSIDVSANHGRSANNQRTRLGSDQTMGDFKQSTMSTDSSIQVTAKMNLYSGGQYSSARRAAHDTALSKRFAIEAAKKKVESGLKGTFEIWQAAKRNIEDYKKQVKAAEIALNATRQEMEVGTKVLKDVLDAEVVLVNAQIAQLGSENTYYTAAYKLVELLGGLHAKALKLEVPYFDPQTFYDKIIYGVQ